MSRIEEIASQISIIIPKFIRAMRMGLPITTKVTAPQLVMLLTISGKGVCRASQLSKEIKISAPTVTGFVDRLMREGYLVRIPDTNDRRAINIKLTPKGEHLVNEFLSHIKKQWKSILLHLTPQEREDYLKFLKRILGVLTAQDKQILD